MACKYTFGKEIVDVSYATLVDKLLEKIEKAGYDMSSITDVLYSRGQMTRDEVYDSVMKIKFEAQLDSEFRKMNMIDGSPDLEVSASEEAKVMTLQQFIDSQYFVVNGKDPMIKMNNQEYASVMAKKMADSGEMDSAAAAKWAERVLQNWNNIAKSANIFHQLMMKPVKSGEYEDSAFEWSNRVMGTPFANISEKLHDAEKECFRQVVKVYGSDKSGSGQDYRVIKGINLKTDLKGIDKELIGHIDYLLIKANGDVEIFNIKTSVEPYSQWSAEKKEKYRYQLALLKRMLEYHGISTRQMRVNIIPVQLKYADNEFNVVNDVRVFNAVSMDTADMQYIFKKYDNVAAEHIESMINFEDVSDEAIEKVNKQMERFFPDKKVHATGIELNAEEWVEKNWRTCNPQPIDGGYKLTVNNQEVIVHDDRRGKKNLEFVSWVREHLETENDSLEGRASMRYLKSDIEDSFRHGSFRSNMRGKKYAFVQNEFSPYLEHKVDPKTGNLLYKWKLVKSPTLDKAGIIMLQNKETNQLDVYVVSAVDPGIKYSFKGQKNLMGYYINDMNRENFTLECNYGNMEMARTLALLNEVLPNIGGTKKLGKLKVIGLNDFHSKKGVYYEFDSVLKEWDKMLKIVNANSDTKIENNFRKIGIETIAPEEILRQVYKEICSDDTIQDAAELRAMDDLFDSRTRTDGTIVPGLMAQNTVAGKIEKLTQIIERIRVLLDQKGIRYGDVESLRNTARSNDKSISSLAKLLIASLQAYSIYNGDIALDNEEFGMIQEYCQRASSAGNTNIRRSAMIIQNGINNINNKIADLYSRKIKPLFDKFYKESGFSDARIATVGDQVKVFKNLYQVDEDGKNLFLFKNPYDMSNDLKSHERAFLKEILFEFHKLRCEMFNIHNDFSSADDLSIASNMPKNYLNVPMQRAQGATRSFLRDPIKAIRQGWQKFTRMITHPREFFEELKGYLTKEDIDRRNTCIEKMRVYNPYCATESSVEYRNALLSDRGEDYFETNVENIFIDFLEKQTQTKEYNNILVRVKGIELALLLKGETEDANEELVKKTLKAIDDILKLNVFNKSIMEPTSEKAETFLQPLRRLVSKVYIAANPVAMVRDTLQGLQENFLMACIKFQTDINAKDVAFAYKEVFRDSVKSFTTAGKLNQFNIKWALSNFDAMKVSERLKRGRNGVLNADNWAYVTLRSPDYLNRMTLFVAKMKHDGVYNAYTLDENGRLKYDWRKDKRFELYAKGDMSDKKKYNEQKSLYFSMIREYNIENPTAQLGYSDDLPDAYTIAQIQSMKNLSESIYGSYDKAMRAKYENTAIGRNFLFFTTWMNGIIDNYTKKRQVSATEYERVQEEDYNGNKLFFELDENGMPNGNVTTNDTGVAVMSDQPIMVQGILQSIGDALVTIFDFKEEGSTLSGNIKRAKEEVWSNAVNRRNFRRAFTDLMVMAILSALFGMWLTPKYKEHKEEDDGSDVIGNAILELLYKGGKSSFDSFKGPLAIIEYVDDSISPAAYDLQTKILSDMVNFVSGKEDFSTTVFGSQALLRSFRDTRKMYVRDVKGEGDSKNQ